MSISNAATIIREFGHKIGQPLTDFEDDWMCTLSFDDILVQLELSEDGLFLACYLWIATIEAERRPAIALEIADANYLLARTQGATFGLDLDSGTLALAARIPDATLTPARFEQTLENLVNLAQAWQDAIANTATPVSGTHFEAPLSPPHDPSFSLRA